MPVEEPARFRDLLLAFSQADDRATRRDIEAGLWAEYRATRRDIEAGLWAEYGAELSVFVLDMSGFSRLTNTHGVVHYLSMVRRMQLTAEPVIRSHGGRVVRFEADNCFATFPAPGAAIQAAVSLNLALDAANLLTPDDLDIHVSVGIDHGRVLLVGGSDFFGNTVNRASKLGEDLAGAGDILVTADAMQRLPAPVVFHASPLTVRISGIDIAAFRIDYRATAEA